MLKLVDRIIMSDIFNLLDNIQKGDSLSVNDRVLIVDGLNLYLRALTLSGKEDTAQQYLQTFFKKGFIFHLRHQSQQSHVCDCCMCQ